MRKAIGATSQRPSPSSSARSPASPASPSIRHNRLKAEMIESPWKSLGYYLLSCLAYIAVLGFICLGVAPFKFHRQFYEQDPSFSYYRSLSDTVSDTELFLLTILISCFSIFLMVFCLSDKQLTNISQEKLKDVAALLISFFTSFSVAGLIITILKILVTRPRPSMFYLCNYQGFRDAVDSGNFSSYLALTSPQTIGDTSHCWDQDYVPDCIYSFPSGHSALAFVSFFWLVEFFLHFSRRFPFMKHLQWLLWLPMILATWIAYSRIYDYKHSELDVVTGALIGVASAHYFFGDFLAFFQEHEAKKKDDLTDALV